MGSRPQPGSQSPAAAGVRQSRHRLLIALAAGGLMPLSLAPFSLWPALFVSLAAAYWLVKDVTHWRQGLFLGWLIGVGKYAVGASWIYVSIHEQGGASSALAGVLVGVFVAGMALFSGIFGAVFGAVNAAASSSDGDPSSSAAALLAVVVRVFVFAASWLVAEWCLTWLLTGFPWLFAGYGLMGTWLEGYAPVFGVLGLSLIGCVFAGLFVECCVGRLSMPSKFSVAAVCAAVAVAGFGLTKVSWVALGERQQVALVQGNIEQITKWNAENRLPILTTYQTLSEPHWGKDLIVWPEAALTLFAQQAMPWLKRWGERGAAAGTTLVLGLPDVELLAGGEQTFQNTALAVGDGSGRYVKRRLVPFGEYVPLESVLRGLIEFFDLPMSRSGSGPEEQPPIWAGGSVDGHATTLGTAICYEIAYPELVRVSAKTADVLITISNDAWFGASIGPHQHLQLAQMRALENGRYVLRSTNNGLTAIINERGEVTATLPQFEPGVLSGDYYPATGRTPFNRFGHYPLLLFAAGLLAFGILVGKRGGILRLA